MTPLGANYEVMVLVEGLVFLAIFQYYALHEESNKYFEYVFNKKSYPTLGNGISMLTKLELFKESPVTSELKTYKELRNEFTHDPFKMKTMYFEGYCISDSLEKLFEQGIKVLNLLSPLVQPGTPTLEEWKRRYKAITSKNVFEVSINKSFINKTR